MIRSVSKATGLSHQRILGASRSASTKTSNHEPSDTTKQTPSAGQESAALSQEAKPEKKETMAELDEELRLKLEGISGGGGEAGLELEDGQPVAMKRGVKQNMFRLI